MRTILIADDSEDFRIILKSKLSKEYCVYDCSDGDSALELLHTVKPDILIMSLMLPYKDGLTVLEEAGQDRPAATLCTTTLLTNYVISATQNLGVTYLILKPCTTRSIISRITDMAQNLEPSGVFNPHDFIATHLDRLGLPDHWDGYLQLYIGIPLYAQDMSQRLYKELYLSIASVCGCDSCATVESSIREAINYAWKNRDNDIWKEYFPVGSDGQVEKPTNLKFIRTLAKLLLKAQEAPSH